MVTIIDPIVVSEIHPLERRFHAAVLHGSVVPNFALHQAIVHLALSHADNHAGAMYQDGKIWEDGVKLIMSLDEELPKGSWEISEELIKERIREV